MLATLIDKPFNDKDWIFEIKWDGYRALAYKNKDVKLLSRNEQSFSQQFPTIVNEIHKLHGSCVLDGEIVILDENGKAKFQLLQNYQKKNVGTPIYYVFDILFYNGQDLVTMTLMERKEILKKMLRVNHHPHILYSDHIEEKGVAFYLAASKNNLEGIIAKKKESTYQSRRSADWLKIKTKLRQEVVICGFTEPRGARKRFGSLLVGVYNGKGELHYVGHVGGGFNQQSIEEVYQKLKKIRIDESPFVLEPKLNTDFTWVKPKLVCEVEFAEWTDDGIMRQPIFKGMRDDKNPKEIIKEKPLKFRNHYMG